MYEPDERCLVFDLDSDLPFPTYFHKYVTETLRTDHILRPEHYRWAEMGQDASDALFFYQEYHLPFMYGSLQRFHLGCDFRIINHLICGMHFSRFFSFLVSLFPSLENHKLFYAFWMYFYFSHILISFPFIKLFHSICTSWKMIMVTHTITEQVTHLFSWVFYISHQPSYSFIRFHLMLWITLSTYTS